jgi:hypothetical protein
VQVYGKRLLKIEKKKDFRSKVLNNREKKQKKRREL